jgi:hypothetical protein
MKQKQEQNDRSKARACGWGVVEGSKILRERLANLMVKSSWRRSFKALDS